MYALKTTGLEQTAIHYKFYKGNTLFSLHNNVDTALKLQILAIVDNFYIRAFKKKYVEYGNLRCLGISTNLKSNYYRINPTSLKHNSAHTNAVYDVNQPFSNIINKIDMDVNFSNARKVTYTPEQVAITAYNLIFSTGYFTDVYHCWNPNPMAKK